MNLISEMDTTRQIYLIYNFFLKNSHLQLRYKRFSKIDLQKSALFDVTNIFIKESETLVVIIWFRTLIFA
jgi:hypothetical protein